MRVASDIVLRSSAAVLAAFALFGFNPQTLAATQSWVTSGTSANWSNGANWAGGAAPGSTTSGTSTDLAIFDTAVGTYGTAGTPVVIDQTTQNIGGITFTGSAGSFHIGSTTGNPLLLTSGGTIQIAGLTVANSIETISAPLVIEGGSGTYTFANSTPSGTGTGSGTLDFVGPITGGTLGGTPGATVLTLTGSNTNANTISGAIGNGLATSLGITETGSGLWVLSGSNSYTGPTMISGGTLEFANENSLYGDGTVKWTGTNIIVGSGGTLRLEVGAASPLFTGTDVTTLLTNMDSTSSATTGFENGSTLALDTTGAGGTFTYAGSITNGYAGGALGLTKLGTGGLTLSGTNTYSGPTTVTSGTLELVTESSLYNDVTSNWTGTNLIVGTGATLQIELGSASPFFTSSDLGTLLSNMDSTSSATTGFESGSILNLDTTNTGGSLSFGSVIGNGFAGGTMSLIKSGSGTLLLAGANTYSGPTTVTSGTLQAGIASVPNVSGAFGNDSALTVANAAGVAVNITGFNTQIGLLSGGGAAGGNVILGSSTLTLAGTSTNTATYAGNVSGAGGSLVMSSSGEEILSGTNTYTGTTTVTSGVLDFGQQASLYDGNSASWTGNNLIVQSGATLGLGIGPAPYFNRATLATLIATLDATSSGTSGFETGSNLGFDTTNANSGVFTYTAPLTNFYSGASNGLTKLGTGTLILTGIDTYSGPTTISGGILEFANEASLYDDVTSSWTASNIMVGNGGTLAVEVGTASPYFTSSDVNTLLTNLDSASSAATGFEPGSSFALDTTGENGGVFTYGNVIGNGFGGASAGLTKIGTGTLDLNGSAVNTYTGATSINSGTLVEDFSNLTTPTNLINPASALTLAGGTLIVTSTIANSPSQTFSGTTLVAGQNVINANNGAAASISLGALTYQAGAMLNFQGVTYNNAPTTTSGQVGSGLVTGTATITTTTAGGAFGLITSTTGGNAYDIVYGTVGLYDLAIETGATAPYSIEGASQGTGGSTGDGAYLIDSGGSLTAGDLMDAIGNVTIHNTTSVPGLRFNAPGAAGLTCGTITSIGTLLITPNVGANNITITTDGNLQPGERSGNGGSTGIVQNNTSGFLNIVGAITDGRAAGSSIVQSGSGTVSYSTNNTYTGATYLDGGTTIITADGGLGNAATGAALYLNGGTVFGNAASGFALDNTGANARPINLLNNGGGLSSTTGITMTADGLISGSFGSGPLVIGIPASTANGNTTGLVAGSGAGTPNAAESAGGTIILSNTANSYSGGTVLDSGILQLSGSIGELGTGGITINGATFQWGSGNTTDISSRTITIQTSGTFDTESNNVTLANSIGNGGAGGFTKVGSGTLTLNGANTFQGGVTLSAGNLVFGGSNVYSGPTAINAGTLTLTSGASLGNTAITVAAGKTLAADSGSGNIQIGTTSASLNLTAGANLTLSDNNTGTLTFNNPGAGTNTLFTLGGTSGNPDNITFDVGGSGSGADEIVFNNGNIVLSGSGTDINLNAFGTTAPTTTSSIPLLSIPNATGVLSLADFNLENSVIAAWTGADYDASLAVNGAGNELLLNLTQVQLNLNFYWTGSTNNTWATISNFATNTTGTLAQSGTLSNSSNVFETASSASNLTQTVGTSAINSLTFTGTNAGSVTLQSGTISINANTAFTDTNTGQNYASGIGLVVEPTSGANTISAAIALGHSQTWEIDNPASAPLTVSGIVSNGGSANSLTKTGIGALILAGNNTYSGGTIIDAGTVALGTNNALLPTGALTVTGTGGAGGTFDLAGFSQTVGSLSDGGTNTGTITASTGASTLNVANSAANSFSGTITDNNGVNGATLGITVNSTSTLTLSGSNSYNGLTTVSGGTLISAANYALGNSAAANGGLVMNPSAGTATVDFTSGSPNLASLASSGAGTSLIVLGNGVANTSTTLMVGGGGQSTVFGGDITDVTGLSGNAEGNLVVDGGTLTLTGSNTFIGTTVVTGGILVLGSTSALLDSTLNYNFQGGLVTFGNVSAATLGALEGGQNLLLSNASAGAVTLTIGNNGATTTYSGAMTAGGSVVFAGGNVTLTGQNAYTGATTVSGGTLTVGTGGAIGTGVTPAGAITQTGGTVNVGSGGAINASAFTANGGVTTNLTGGLLNISGAMAINSNNSDLNGLLTITSGTANTNSVTIGRDGTSDGDNPPALGATGDGIYVNGGLFNIATTLSVGEAGGDNSTANMRQDAGTIIVGGVTTITNDAGGRFSVLNINGGTFTDGDTSGVGINIGNTNDAALDAELLVTGSGVVNTPAITLGATAQPGGIDVFQALGGITNIGSGGIVSGGATATTLEVLIGSTAVATTPTITATSSWSSSLPITLSNNSAGAAPIFQTRVGANITLSGALSGSSGLVVTGSGLFTLSGANTYTGTTFINGGTVAAASATALGATPVITFGGGTLRFSGNDTVDYSPVIVNSTGAISIDTNGQQIVFATPFAASNTGGLSVIDSTGGGSLTLTASNSYTGATNIGTGGDLILSSTGTSVAALGNTAIAVATGATFGAKPNSGNIQIGTTGASLTLGAGANFTMADGTVGTLTINGNGSPATLNLGGTTSSPDNLTFDVGTAGADQLIVNNGGVSFASSAQDDIYLDTLGGAAPASLSSIPILVAPGGSLSLSDFFLESPLITFNGSVYTASLSLGDSNTELLVSLLQGAPSTYYFTGAQSSSWSNISNFATDQTGDFAQSSGTLNHLSDVFLTANSPTAGNFATETLDGNYTINSLSFTGTGTGAGSTSITLANSSGATIYTLTLAAGASFGDASGNNYGVGTGLVVQPGSAAQTISADIDLGASQTWKINNPSSNPLTVSGVIADAPATSHDALTLSGSGELILANANTYDGGTTVSGATLMLGPGGSLSSSGILTVTSNGTFDLGGNNQTVGGLSDGGGSTGTITSSIGNATLTINNSSPATFSGKITDNNNVNGASLALNLAGPSNITLSGSNSFTGGITLVAGNLTVANNYALGSETSATGGLTFNNTTNSTIFFTSANPQVASINNGPLQTGSGNIVLGGTSNGGTSTTLALGDGGTAQTNNGDIFSGSISDQSALAAGAVGNLNIINGAFVELTGANTFTGTTLISGSNTQTGFPSLLELGNSLALQNSTLNYSDPYGTISFGNLTAVTLAGLEGSDNLTLNNGGTGPVTLTIGNNNVSSAYTGVLNGAGTVTKVGSGIVQFGSGITGGAAYAGSTTVNQGTLIIGGYSDLTGAVDVTGANGTSTLTVQDNAIINASTALDIVTTNSTGYPSNAIMTVTGTSNVTVPGISFGTGAGRVPTGVSLTIADSASLTDNGSLNFIQTDGGTSTEAGVTVNLNGGTLAVQNFILGNAGSNAGSGAILNLNGGTLEALANDPAGSSFLPVITQLSVEVDGGGAIINSNGFNITIAKPLVSGTTNDGGLTKLGGGILTLGGSNNYNGPTNIEAGELALGNSNALLNTSAITFNGSGGALQYSGTNTKDYSNKILNSTAPIAIDTNGQSVTFASPLAGSNTGGLVVENATPNVGGLTLTAAEAYAGPSVVQSGAELILGAGGSTPAGSNLTISGSLTALAGNGGIGGNVNLGSGSSLSLVDGNTGSLTIGGALTIGAAGAASLDFEFNSSADTTDSVTVNGGTLVFGAGGGVINVTDLASTSSPVTATQYTLLSDGAGLGADAFTLGESSVLIDGTNYLLSLSNGGTSEILKLTAASLNYYWTGAHSSSWNNIQNFAPNISGTPAQTGTLTAASNVFLTATANVVNAPNTIDGNFTINSLSFTGTASGITLASGTSTLPLTIAAQAQFADQNNTTYPVGTGIVVQAGAGANTISSPITLGNSQTWDINNSSSNPLTVSGVIVGSGASLTKAGVGTLVLNNTETYTGGTIITGGTLTLGAGGSLPSGGALTVSGTGTFDLAGQSQLISSLSDGGVSTGVITSSTGAAILTIDNSTASTYSGAINDLNGANGSSLALVIEGTSNVILSGSSTYSGGTTLTNGTLTVSNNYGLGNASSINANAGLDINPGLSGTAEAIFTSANPHLAALDSGTNGIATVSLGNSAANTATTLNLGAASSTSVFNGSIINSGTGAIGSLVVTGGSLTLNGSDSFTGTTVVAAGTLVLGNTNALTGSVVNYNNQGGTLNFGALNGATIGGLEGAENLALTNANSAPVALTIQNMSTTATYSGALSGGGSLVVTGSGGGSQTFAGVNTYTGTTTFGSLGTSSVTIASGGAIGTPAAAAAEIFQTTGNTLNIANGGSIYTTSVSSNGGGIINVPSGAILSATGTMAINENNADLNGLLAISGGTVTANSITVGRDGTNDGATLPMTGGTADGIYVSAGTLSVATTLSVGTAASAENSTANFRMDGGTVTVGGIATVTNAAASRYSTLDVNGGVFTDQDTSGVGIQIGGNADGGLDAELLVRNTGVLNTPAITLGSATQTGGTDVFNALGGTTNIGAGGIVSGSGGAVTLVDLGSASVTTAPVIAASASWSSSTPMNIVNSAAGAAPTFLTTSGSNITLTGSLTGSGGINAKGTGILTLGGVNTLGSTAAVAVSGSGGRLIVSGSLTGIGTVTVGVASNLEVDGLLTSGNAAAISGRLSGIGSIDGANILTSGTLASGFSTGSTSAGILTSTGNVSFATTASTLSIRLGVTNGASGDNDQLLMANTSTLTLNDTTLRLSLGAGESGASAGSLYDIVNGGASGTGSGIDVFANAPASGDSITVGTQVFDVFYGVAADSTTPGTGSDIAVELVSVPEPGTWAEIIAGIGVLCIWQQSRRRDPRNA
jgi:fibronectin-binding autotransporter adhesin